MSITLWCLFIAGLLHVLSKTPLFQAQHKSPEGYDNNNPREQQASLDGLGCWVYKLVSLIMQPSMGLAFICSVSILK